MNKKRLAVAWLAGIIIALIFLGAFIESYEQPLDNLFRAIGYSMPVAIIGGLLSYTLRKAERRQENSKTALLKELPHDKELLTLLNRRRYAEAMDLIVKMRENNVWSDEDAIVRGRLCAEAHAVSLYGAAAKFAGEKDYDKAVETSKALSSFILKHPEFFGLSVDDLAWINTEIHAKIDENPILSMGEVQELKEQILNSMGEATDKRTVGHIRMLLDALFMTEFWKSERENNKEG